MHLSPEFDLTINRIRGDGFHVDREIEMLLSSDTAVGATKSIGLGMIGFADALAQLRPDLMLLLGDRYELLAAAPAALIRGVPIAHLHGGEITEGAIDESIRHSITKMSHLHFVAAEPYRRRVIQLGENPNNVFTVGGLGIDNILRQKMLSREELEIALDFKLRHHNLLIAFHPVTLEKNSGIQHLEELLLALETQKKTSLIFTMSNSDEGGRAFNDRILAFCATNPNARSYKSLGQLHFLSCLKHFDGIVGNSSSGIIEAPSLRTGTINVGDRQLGRLRAASVIDCKPDRLAIEAALTRLYSDEFKSTLVSTGNPYGNGGASESIVRILEDKNLQRILKKKFYNINF
jgi:GDP/UDP-N,N'-diacetylbacillosamine 2-epimerase (hydrolysing)